MPRKRLLLVDDDAEFVHVLADQVALLDEFDFQAVASGKEALNAARTGHSDLILLEVTLPDMDGRDVCRVMRRLGVESPIIILTEIQSEADIILGFEAGASDYVAKPLKFGELLARIRAQLREADRADGVLITVGTAVFDPQRNELTGQRGNVVQLSEMEAAILLYLCNAAEVEVSREEFLTRVWTYNAGAKTHTVETSIYRLRQKLKAAIPGRDILITRKTGYVLIR